MAEEIRADLLLGRDSLTPGLLKAGRAAKDAGGDVKSLTQRLYELNRQRATPVIQMDDQRAQQKLTDVADKLRRLGEKAASAKIDVKDKDAQARIARIFTQLDDLDRKTSSPRITLDGVAKVQAEILALDAQLDRLGRKRETVTIAERLKKISGAGALSPSPLAAGIALAPSLIPLTAGVAAGVAGITASFGAAAVGAAGFGKVASTVLSGASQDAAKLQAAQMRLNAAQTAAQKKSARQALETLTASWSAGYKKLIFDLRDFQNQWKGTAQQIAVPSLLAWLKALSDGMHFLKPALDPVAHEFRAWGQDLDRYFTSRKGSDEVTRIAHSLGQLSASQLGDAVTAIGEIGKGVAQLGRDAGISAGSIAGIGGNLDTWATAFDDWAHSDAARKDVQGFLRYLHQNGPTVTSTLENLAKDLGGFTKGASGLGSVELKAIDDFLGLLAKLPPSAGKPILETAGALLLLSKTGVLKVGIRIVGAASKLLSGGTLALGGASAAAEIRAAFATGGAAAAGEIRAAMAGGGAIGAGESALGGAGAAVGAGAAGISAGGAVAITAGALVAAGTEAVVVKKAFDLGEKAGHAAGREFAHVFLPDAFKPLGTGVPPGFVTALTSLGREIGVAGKQMAGDFTRQRAAAHAASSALSEYTSAIRKNGVNSSEARSARASLIRDLENAGVKSDKATTDVNRYTAAVRKDGADSDAARGARRRLVNDILDASGNSRRGRTDMNNLATAIQNHGAKSDAARAARQRLIRDLENAGVSAKNARNLVNEFSTSIRKIPKPETVTIHAHGAGKTTFKVGTTGLVGMASGGKLPGYGGGDRHLRLLESGEAVVDKVKTQRFAPVLKAMGVPGMETGGVAGSQSGTPPSTGRWMTGQEAKVQDMAARFIAADLAKLIDQAQASAMGPTSASARQAQAYARSRLGAFGWGAGQMPPLIALWNGESGWNRLARNPSSGAYGIPQALPASKMGAAANPPRSSAGAQINWGLGYIRSTYGSPGAAYSAWSGRSPHWYAGGTGGAAPGWAVVGEEGPELVKFKGGEPVLSAAQSSLAAAMGGYAKGTHTPLNEKIDHVLRYVRSHPDQPVWYGRRADDMQSLTTRLHNERVLIHSGHVHGSALAHLRRELSRDTEEHKHLARTLRSYSETRRWVRHVMARIAARDRRFGGEIAAAHAEHLPGVAGYFTRREKADLAASKRMSAWLGRVEPVYTRGQKASDKRWADSVISRAVREAGLPAATFDSGGLLKPGITLAVNNTGRPEMVIPARGNGQAKIVLEVRTGHGASAMDRAIVEIIKKYVSVNGGNAQVALGADH
ncbi:MAG: hypothetical protein J2P30_00520 [Actinobacteria bacterium]|nr:hypothetical protein [Actinomycetota bacterium]